MSYLLQIVVDQHMVITSVYTGWPGCVHDARVLRNSMLYDQAEEGNLFGPDKFIIGDSAYPLRRWLDAPFRNAGNLNPERRVFNRRVSSMRQVVERAFGHLKGRFRRLKNVHLYDCRGICYAIYAGCILHNLCVLSGDEVEEYIEEQDENDHPNNFPPLYGNAREGVALRDRLVAQMRD